MQDPSVFLPVLETDQFLVDGAVLNPLPVNLVSKKDNELIIAVDVNGSPAIPFESVVRDAYTEARLNLEDRVCPFASRIGTLSELIIK